MSVLLSALIATSLSSPDAMAICGEDLVPPGGVRFDSGSSVALAHFGLDYAVVGRPSDGLSEADVFQYNGAAWSWAQSLAASDEEPGTRFGTTAAAFADVIVVGAPEKHVGGHDKAGAVYVFRNTGGTWIEEAKLTAPVPQTRIHFGGALAVHGDVIAIGTTPITPPVESAGSLALYRYNGTDWVHEETLISPDPQVNDFFGLGVTLDQDRLLVGAPGYSATASGAGAAYLFSHDGLSWNLDNTLEPAVPSEFGYFGLGIGLYADTAVIGAPGPAGPAGNGRFGAVYVYQWSQSTWSLDRTLLSPDGGDSNHYGREIAVDEDFILVGSRGADHLDGGVAGEYGAGFLYGRTDGTGTLLTQLYREDTTDVGRSVDVLNGWAIVGVDYRNPSQVFPVGMLGSDCDTNGVNDACDLDCDQNGLVDACEGTSDCNDNGLVDSCDIAVGLAEDCIGNAIPDECDILDGTDADCTGDGIPDTCNIAEGDVSDCNLNAVPDPCDIAAGTSGDCNLNSIPDECDTDCNQNAAPDDCDIADGSSDDCNSNAIPDECEPLSDCNANTIPDPCDITDGTSDDCNADFIPDECQPVEDCNDNGVTDICDIGAGVDSDCNGNLRPDACDLADGISTDLNGNGVLDVCEGGPRPDATFHIDGSVRTCTTDADCLFGISPDSEVYCIPPPFGSADPGICYVQRNKYISTDPNPAQDELLTARRVSLLLDGGGTAVLGWIGEPTPLDVAGGPQGGPAEASPQLLSRIEADPHYRDWAVDNGGLPWVDPTVHVGDCEISPGHTYHLQSIVQGADILDEADYSEPLELRTVTNWGDVTGGTTYQPPDKSRNFKDINAVIRGFQSVQKESKVWLDLYGPLATPYRPDFTDISFTDINASVAGFQGASYPFFAPLDCPDQIGP